MAGLIYNKDEYIIKREVKEPTANDKIFLSFLQTLYINNICLFNEYYRCQLRTFFRGKTDSRLEIKVYSHVEVKTKLILTLFLAGNHNTPRGHYTIEKPHVLDSIHEVNKGLLDDDDRLKRFIKFLIYFCSIWRSCVEFDSEELYNNSDPNIDALILSDEKYLKIFQERY